MREPIELDLTKALGAALNAACKAGGGDAALSIYLDGRNIEGDWALEITAARLVSREPNGAQPPPFASHGPGKRKRK